MKTVYLIRHSIPEKDQSIENENIPLSLEGKILAKNLFDKLSISSNCKIFSSPYLRARQTAEAFSSNIIIDDRLIERKIGDKSTFTKEIWTKQYLDLDAANKNGESFRMVRERMNKFMNTLIENMGDGETVIVVSHAAAICAYLQQFCEINVTDVDAKARHIIFHDKTVLDGKINTPSCFILNFDEALVSISYIE